MKKKNKIVEKRIDSLGEDSDELPYADDGETTTYHFSNGQGDTVSPNDSSSHYVRLKLAPDPLNSANEETVFVHDDDGLKEEVSYSLKINTINPDEIIKENIDYSFLDEDYSSIDDDL